jgi:hypothetical protein
VRQCGAVHTRATLKRTVLVGSQRPHAGVHAGCSREDQVVAARSRWVGMSIGACRSIRRRQEEE